MIGSSFLFQSSRLGLLIGEVRLFAFKISFRDICQFLQFCGCFCLAGLLFDLFLLSVCIKGWFAVWDVMNFLLVLLCLVTPVMTFILSYAVIVEETCVCASKAS